MSGSHPIPSQRDPELVRVGATIKVLREARGLSQEQLSSRALISRAYLANIETGRKRPSMKAVARIAAALSVPQISIMVESMAVAA